MSATPPRKTTIKDILRKKQDGERVIALGVYDSPMAMIADEVGFDLLINGNAGPMSLLGHPTPLTVSFEEQLALTKAVSRVARRGMVVAHMPYMTYNVDTSSAIRNAAKLVQLGGADCIKCEGNRSTAKIVKRIVDAGIPAIGHMGMQASRKLEQSGFGFKGRRSEDAAKIVEDSCAFVDAGVFAIIIEYVPYEITEYLARTLPIPVISVGSGPSLDGIYIASSDVVGYSAFPRPKNEPSFVDIRPTIQSGLLKYKRQVLERQYPGSAFTIHMADVEYQEFLALVQ